MMMMMMLLLRVCSIFHGIHAKGVNRCHGARCAVRTWDVLCGVRVAAESPEHDYFLR